MDLARICVAVQDLARPVTQNFLDSHNTEFSRKLNKVSLHANISLLAHTLIDAVVIDYILVYSDQASLRYCSQEIWGI